MPIIYSLVAQGTTILADFSEATGNFAIIAEEILQKVQDEGSPRMTFVYDKYHFHYLYDAHGGNLVYMCMCDSDFGRRMPFAFLADTREKFKPHAKAITDAGSSSSSGGGGGDYQAIMYGFNHVFQPVLAERMDYYSNSASADKISQVRNQIDDIRDVMVKNIEKVLERDGKIEVLVNRTDELESSSMRFRRSTKAVHDKFWWKRMKWRVVLGIVLVLVLALVAYLVYRWKFKK